MPPKATPKPKPRNSTPTPIDGGAGSSNIDGGARASGSGASGAEESFLANAHGDTEIERQREERAGRGGVERSDARNGEAWSVPGELSSPPGSEMLSLMRGNVEGQQDENGLGGNDGEEEQQAGDGESRGDDTEQRDGVGSEHEEQEEQGGASRGHATTRSGRKTAPPVRDGFVDNNQRYRLGEAAQGSARQGRNGRAAPRAPTGAARAPAPAPAPASARRAAGNNNDVADSFAGILDSTVRWLEDGASIARQLRTNRTALVNALKRPSSGGGPAPGVKKSRK
jgi:hypothetical protein